MLSDVKYPVSPAVWAAIQMTETTSRGSHNRRPMKLRLVV
jgi:hypothetical protein